MKKNELKQAVKEFKEKVARIDGTGNAKMVFYESGEILNKFILDGEVDTRLYEEFANLRYIVYSNKKSAAAGAKNGK